MNVLLSFAQFEREVTGERIRDKIAASKAKGMWLGGMLPLGYDAPTKESERGLVVNEIEAEKVRDIFRRFVAEPSLHALQKSLRLDGVRSKIWVTRTGRHLGGHNFSRGALRYLLANRLYRGEILHKGVAYPGRHSAIVPTELFAAAEDALRRGAERKRAHVPKRAGALLDGLVFDADGHPMDFLDTKNSSGRLYRVYVAKAHRRSPDAVRWLSAAILDRFITERLAHLVGTGPDDMTKPVVRSLVRHITIDRTTVTLTLHPQAEHRGPAWSRIGCRLRPGEQFSSQDEELVLRMSAHLTRSKGRAWLYGPGGDREKPPQIRDTELARRLVVAHRLAVKMGVGPSSFTENRAEVSHEPTATERKQLQWAFLAPDLQQQIIRGELIAHLPLRSSIPLLWADQRRLFGQAS